MVNNWLNIALSRLFPYRCVLCQQLSEIERDLCLSCAELLARIPDLHCTKCAIPLEAASSDGTPVCGDCIKHTPHFDHTAIPYIYTHGIRRLISQLKFNNKLLHAGILGELFIEQIQDRVEPPEALIPMPLHSKRLRQRGYNQSLLLAKAIGKQLDIRVDNQLCRRVKHTPPQAELTRKARMKNMKGVFEIIEHVPYRHIAIVDDVMTTGSSINELAKQFKAAGVRQVDAWCIARTLKQ